MTERSGILVFDHDHIDEIPRFPGVYGFFFRFPTLSDYGIFEDSKMDIASLRLLKAHVMADLDAMHDVLSLESYEASLSNGRQRNLKKQYVGDVSRIPGGTCRDLVECIEPTDLPFFLKLLSAVSLFSTPIYVGMTSEQTLHDRIRQHRENYERRSPSTFGGRLALARVPWERIRVATHAAPLRTHSKEALSAVEGLLHQFSSPLFGIS